MQRPKALIRKRVRDWLSHRAGVHEERARLLADARDWAFGPFLVTLHQSRRDVDLCLLWLWLPASRISELTVRGKCFVFEIGVDDVSRGGSIHGKYEEVSDEGIRKSICNRDDLRVFSSLSLCERAGAFETEGVD